MTTARSPTTGAIDELRLDAAAIALEATSAPRAERRSNAGPARQARTTRPASADSTSGSRRRSMFGGGTMAIVLNPGALVVQERGSRRVPCLDRRWSRPGNALAIVDARTTPERSRRLRQEALRDAVAAAGGEVRQFRSPKGGALVRLDRGRAAGTRLALAPGRGRGACRSGSAGSSSEGDVERRQQAPASRSMELDKLALYRGHGGDQVPTTSARSSLRRCRVRCGRSSMRSASAEASRARAPRAALRVDAGAGPRWRCSIGGSGSSSRRGSLDAGERRAGDRPGDEDQHRIPGGEAARAGAGLVDRPS